MLFCKYKKLAYPCQTSIIITIWKMYILSKIFRNSIKSVRAHCVPILKIVLINLSRKQETTHNSKTGTEYDFMLYFRYNSMTGNRELQSLYFTINYFLFCRITVSTNVRLIATFFLYIKTRKFSPWIIVLVFQFFPLLFHSSIYHVQPL